MTQQQDRVKLCVRGLYDAQTLRIQLELRILRLVRDEIMSEKEAKTFFKLPFAWFEKAEHEMQKMVWKEVKDWPIVKRWLIRVRGIGPRLSGLLVANIGDIGRFDTVSKLWAYAGLAVHDGHAQKRVKGQKANWNDELKKTAWKIGQSFVKAGGPYRELYDRYKARIIERELTRGTVIYHKPEGKWIPFDSHAPRENQTGHASHCAPDALDDPASQALRETHSQSASQDGLDAQPADASQSSLDTQKRSASQEAGETHLHPASHLDRETQSPSASPEWTLGRINNMATRYVAKRLLAHLWQVWRELEGLPTRPTYPTEYLGHTSQDDPWDYITPEGAKVKSDLVPAAAASP